MPSIARPADQSTARGLTTPLRRFVDRISPFVPPDECYLTTPEMKPARRRGGFISFLRKQ